MKTVLKICLSVCLFLCAAAPFARAQTPAPKPTPEEWLKTKGMELIDILSVKDAKTRFLKLRKIARQVFHQTELPRLAMGRHWNAMTESQREALRSMFFDYFVVTYGSVSLGFDKVDLNVTDKVPSGRDILLKVSAAVSFANGANRPDGGRDAALEMFFALRETPDGYYIRDAKIEGQSVLMFLRSKMDREMRAAQSVVDDFLESMRVRINSRYRAAEDLSKADAAKKRAVR